MAKHGRSGRIEGGGGGGGRELDDGRMCGLERREGGARSESRVTLRHKFSLGEGRGNSWEWFTLSREGAHLHSERHGTAVGR